MSIVISIERFPIVLSQKGVNVMAIISCLVAYLLWRLCCDCIVVVHLTLSNITSLLAFGSKAAAGIGTGAAAFVTVAFHGCKSREKETL